jgi:putative YjhG/YagF family dehydratase
MLIALAAQHGTPVVVVPGGVTLPPTEGEDAGKVQTIGVRYAQGELTLAEAAELGCRACATPGGGCQFLGTAATSQVVAEALGLSVLHAALAPSGQPIWLDLAVRSARALAALAAAQIPARAILTQEAIENAMVVHAAFGGSTNLLLHIPAIAHAAGLRRPTVEDWTAINRRTPRLVDVLPNGPSGHPTVRAYLAGGVPEVMLHLAELGLLHLDARTVEGVTLGQQLAAWAKSDRRGALRERLAAEDGVDPDDVILSPARARAKGLTSTVTFPIGNLAPQGSVVKSTAIDPTVVDPDGVYRKLGPARVFTSERAAIAALKGLGERPVVPGDILVLMGRGPLGCGMEETYQVTAALKHLAWGKHVALLTDARFSGVSTGACLGHIGPEALAGGPLGKLRDGDLIRIEIDRNQLTGRVDFLGSGEEPLTPEAGAACLAARAPHPDLAPDPHLPADTRLWAALQEASGGIWGGCVYDVEAIVGALHPLTR